MAEKKKYLISGITGFCSPHLANNLIEQGHEVVGLTRRTNGMYTDILDVVPQENFNKIRFVIADLTDRDSLMRIFSAEKFDGVFHLAAMSLPPQSFIDPVGTMKENVIGTINLIDVVEKTQGLECKFLFCSTSEVYGNGGKNGVPIKETAPLTPSNPYGSSKACAEIHLQERMLNGKINGVITRAFSHTSARRGKNFSISSDAYQIAQFMLENDQEKEYELRVGNLQTVRCVLDARDVCEAYRILMENPKSSGNVYNICATSHHKMEHFTDILIGISGLKIKKVIDEKLYRPIDIQFQHGDITALKSLTKWEPKYDINITMADLLEYWITKLSSASN